MIEQHRFLSRVQSEGETIGEYVAAIQKFLPNCNFNCEATDCRKSVSNQFLRAQFIRGISSSYIREKLLEEKSISFKEAVEKALTLESSYINNLEIKKTLNSNYVDSNYIDADDVHKVSSFRATSSSKPKSDSQSNRNRSRTVSTNSNQRFNQGRPKRNYKELGIDDLCFKCGMNNHRQRNCRVDREKLHCDSCKRKGHVSKVCFYTLTQKNRIQNLDDEYQDEPVADFGRFHDMHKISMIMPKSEYFLNYSNCNGNAEKYLTTVDIENQPVQ